jgi:hypothetical protein
MDSLKLAKSRQYSILPGQLFVSTPFTNIPGQTQRNMGLSRKFRDVWPLLCNGS